MKHLIATAIAISMVCTVFLASGRDASACSCGSPYPIVTLPTQGATDVPVNTRFWFSRASTQYIYPVFIQMSTGYHVPATRTLIDALNGTIVVVTPNELLEAHQTYEVAEYRNDGEMYFGQLTTFTTGTAVDNIAPELPVETDRVSSSWNRCLRTCTSDGSQVEILLTGEGLFLVDVGGAQTLDAEQCSGFVTTASQDGIVTLGGTTTRGCGGPWPGGRGETMSIRYGSFDLAGNFSGWTEESTVTMPKVPAVCSCNCSTTQAEDISLLAIMMLCFLLYNYSRARRIPQN